MALVYNPASLRDAIKGRDTFFDEIRARRVTIETTASDMVSFLQRLPSSDKEKKAALASYFQTDEGSRYTREQRKEAYDSLLGVERNRRTIG